MRLVVVVLDVARTEGKRSRVGEAAGVEDQDNGEVELQKGFCCLFENYFRNLTRQKHAQH